MRAHDGFLTAESHPEKGTTISLYFPLVDEKPNEIVSENVSVKSAASEIDSSLNELMGNNEHILVVEDEKTVRELLITMLSSLGYKVSSCDNGAEAFELARNKSFDLILIDAILPKLGGAELLAKLQESGIKSRYLLMSGYGSTFKPQSGTTKLINKPFDLDTLGLAIKDSLAPLQ